ncbi:MAG: hypothetical protein F4X65_09485 [Chloroflexi bacterium]|nr:hypothetical protein [Chloroflexota bacterium]
MNHSPQWPFRHILIGIPIVLAVSYSWGGAMKGWGVGDETLLASATLLSVVGAGYTFLVTVAERSYYMVFWAREKIKEQFEEARREAEARGEAKGEARGRAKGAIRREKAWRDWYDRMQAAQRDGVPFNEPPPPFAEHAEE